MIESDLRNRAQRPSGEIHPLKQAVDHHLSLIGLGCLVLYNFLSFFLNLE